MKNHLKTRIGRHQKEENRKNNEIMENKLVMTKEEIKQDIERDNN